MRAVPGSGSDGSGSRCSPDFLGMVCQTEFGEKALCKNGGIYYYWSDSILFLISIPTIRDDAKSVYDTAAAMADGDYSSLNPGGYLYVYPYQIGIVTYDRIVRLFSGSMKFLEVLNLAQVLGINWFSYRLSDHFFGGNRKINNLTILLTFAFLPQFFFIMFKYGLIPGFFFSIGSFYFLTIYLKNNRLRYVVLSVVFATAASCIKMNYLIGAIAAAAIFGDSGGPEPKMEIWSDCRNFFGNLCGSREGAGVCL